MVNLYLYRNHCSIFYCRPIQLLFKKETAKLIKLDVNIVESRIKTLSVSSKVYEQYYISNAISKEINKLECRFARSIDETTLSFGLSSLHS